MPFHFSSSAGLPDPPAYTAEDSEDWVEMSPSTLNAESLTIYRFQTQRIIGLKPIDRMDLVPKTHIAHPILRPFAENRLRFSLRRGGEEEWMTLTDQAWDHVIQQCSIPEIKVELLGVRPTTTGTIINPSSATNPSLTTNPPRTMRLLRVPVKAEGSKGSTGKDVIDALLLIGFLVLIYAWLKRNEEISAQVKPLDSYMVNPGRVYFYAKRFTT